jgi:arylsulfatase A-like enzyme
LQIRSGALRLSGEERRHLIGLYLAGIRQADAELGEFIDFLDAGHWRNRTHLIVTSDHGEEFFEHGGVLHGRTQFEELLRVPLLVRGPGIPPGARYDVQVSLIDIVPTVLSLAGLDSSEGLDGLDLTLLLQGGDESKFGSRVLFSEADHYRRHHDVLRSARYRGLKLIRNRETKKREFFDLREDPGELRDRKSEHPDALAFLEQQLREFEKVRGHGTTLPEVTDAERARLEALGYLE